MYWNLSSIKGADAHPPHCYCCLFSIKMCIGEGDCAGLRGCLCRSEKEVVQIKEVGGCAGQRGMWLWRSEREVVQVREGDCAGQRGRLYRSEKEVVNVIGIGCADHTQDFYDHSLIYRHAGTGTDRKEMKSLCRCWGDKKHKNAWVMLETRLNENYSIIFLEV